MTNLPPPDPRSSRLGFDELVAVVVAFAVIGTILVVSLRDKNKGFSLEGLTPLLTRPQPKPNATTSPTPTGLLPKEQEATPLPAPTANPPATPTPQATLETRGQVSQTTTIVPVPPPVVTVPSPVETVPKTVNFPDVPQVFWARPYIEALAGRDIITGFPDGTFGPNKPVTRAEFAAQLQKAFDQKVVMAAPNYKDVPDKFWASSAIRETTRSGFLRGYPGNVFRPNQKIPKVQALVALTKGLGFASTSSPKQVLQVYQDANKIPKYATPIVAVATESGLVVNYPNRKRLDPNKNITRAEAAALTYQAMVKAGKAKPISSEYTVLPSSKPKK